MSANGIGNSIHALQKVFWMTLIGAKFFTFIRTKLKVLGAHVCPTHIEFFEKYWMLDIIFQINFIKE